MKQILGDIVCGVNGRDVTEFEELLQEIERVRKKHLFPAVFTVRIIVSVSILSYIYI